MPDHSMKQARPRKRIGKDWPAQTGSKFHGCDHLLLFLGQQATNENSPLIGVKKRKRGLDGGLAGWRFRASNWELLVKSRSLRWQQRLTKRHIQLHRPRVRSCAKIHRCTQWHEQILDTFRILRARQIHGVSHKPAKYSTLVNGLVCPRATQFRRPVGCQENQWHTGVGGFHTGWQEVGHCGTTGRHANGWFSSRHGPAQRGK